ncbi:MAG: HD domain-containing protein, partial [Syntrophothermus sp.]
MVFEGKFQAIKEAVEKELSCSAHDLDHVMRVYNLCLYLARNEAGVNGAGVDVDIEVLKAAALLHDIARVREDRDGSGSIDHAVLGARMAEEILVDMDYPGEKVEQVKHCIRSHRFRGGNEPQTIEAKILFDADKLDAMGAVGVARFFMVAGEYGEK